MKHPLLFLIILQASILESCRQEKTNLDGTWVLQKTVIDGQIENMGSNPIDTIFFSGDTFRQVKLINQPFNMNVLGTLTGNYRISGGKLELTNLKRRVGQSTSGLSDEKVSVIIRENEIIIEHQITIHTTGQTVTEGACMNYYKKI
jgi:hypothetical protein